MAQAVRTGIEEEIESFHQFFGCWLVEKNQYLQELVSASRAESTQDHDQERVLRPLIDRLFHHYECYYRVKSRWVKHDAWVMLSPSWLTTPDDASHWLGDWRPTLAFHLLLSQCGLQLEARVDELIRGLPTGKLGDLSVGQLNLADDLHRKTISEEKEIGEKMAKQQQTELSDVMSELMRSNEASPDRVIGIEEERVGSILASKKEGMEEILKMADDLRLTTLKEVIAILSPIQAVLFFRAAAERFHGWGKKRHRAYRGIRHGMFERF